MLTSRIRKLCGVFEKQRLLYYNQHRLNGFIVLLPEVDPEIADKLITTNDELPAFSNITTEKLGKLIGKHILDYECCVRNADRKLEESPHLFPNVFEDVLDPLERPTSSFDTVWGVLKTLYLGDIKIVPARIYSNLEKRINIARATRYNTDAIFKACKNCDKNKLTEEQARLIDKHLLEGHLNGLESTPRYRSINNYKTARLLEKQTQFRIRVEAARSQFYLTLDDPFAVRECPAYLLQMMSHEGDGSYDGPWTVKLNYGIAEKYLEYCPDRNLRFMIWHAEDKAASLSEEVRELANSVCLEEIRYLRYELAKCVGYKNHFEANLITKMADSVENIENTFEMFLEVAKPAQYNEVVKLQEFADANHFAHPIQLWDLPYWGRRHKKALFNFDNELLRNFLPFEKVIDGLFALCKRLFGFKFQEFKEVDSWHPDVKFYYIYEPDNEKPVAGFYMDPYRRSTKMKTSPENMYMIPIRNSSRIPRPLMPLTALILNLQPPTKEKPCLMSFSEVKSLFAKFGHNLQYLLSKSSYTEIAGLNFVEFDATEVCSNFMINWLYDRKTFDGICGHYKTGEKFSHIDLDGLRKHLVAFRLCKEMFKAQMDIKMHTKHDIFWLDLGNQLWDKHFIFPRSKYFSDPCRYIDIFASNWGSAYYSHLWSEMLAADIHQAFSEEKDEASVGARFRDTFLTFGGGCHAKEVFRRFRGRDPNPVALLTHFGLTEDVKTISTEDPKLLVTC